MLAVASKSRSYPVLLPDAVVRGQQHRTVRRRGRAHPMRRAVVVALLLVVPAIAYVNQSTRAARAGYAILTLRHQIDALQGENQRLVARVTELRAPDRIEGIATKRLGLGKPRGRQLVTMTLPARAVAVVPSSPPTIWQRLIAPFLGHEAAAGETR